MSKSSSSPQGIIDLLDEPAAIRKKINRAVTDAESVVRADDEAKPGVTNLLRIYAALSGEKIDDIAARYGDGGYGGFKKDLGNLVADTFAPVRERTAKYLDDPGALDALLDAGARRAHALARETMAQVRLSCGFPAVYV
jgi:tryptophanyl-tRNA synthetase